MSDMMRRWEMSALGLENLKLHKVDKPVLQEDEVLVKIDNVSLNYRDTEVVSNGMGIPLSFPFTPTSDMAGRVVAIGSLVERVSIGDDIVSAPIPGWIDGSPFTWVDAPTLGGPLPGMLSEFVKIPSDWCVLAPNSLSPAQSSTLPTAGLTAWEALVELGDLKSGDTVVVQGTGGVSLFAIQLAASMGANVVVTSSSEQKLNLARGLGAQHGINRSSTPAWDEIVLDLTNGLGADHILEMAGGESALRSLNAIRPGGRISVIGLLESLELRLPILRVLEKRVSLVGISIGSRRALEDFIKAVDRLSLKPVIDSRYPFDSAPDAFRRVAQGAFGKVVIDF